MLKRNLLPSLTMSGCAYLMQVSLLFSVWYSVFSYFIELIVFYHNSCFDYYANIF
jgi:hypothetical protein